MMKDAPMVVEPLKPEDDPDVDIVLSFRSQIVCDKYYEYDEYDEYFYMNMQMNASDEYLINSVSLWILR